MARDILQWFPFAAAWLHSKMRPATFRATCARCPNWIRQGSMSRPTTIFKQVDGEFRTLFRTETEKIGVCALDQAKIFNDFTTGFALKAWTGEDQCSRHPLYLKHPLPGSDLVHDPMDPATQKFGGFNRLPDFAEAMKMAVAAHEKPGVPVQPELARIVDRTLTDHKPRLVMGKDAEGGH